jgi:hypothetical protein
MGDDDFLHKSEQQTSSSDKGIKTDWRIIKPRNVSAASTFISRTETESEVLNV